MPLRSVRRTYNRVAIQGDAPTTDDGNEENNNSLDEPLSPSSSFDGEEDGDNNMVNNGKAESSLNQSALSSSPSALPPIINEIHVTLLDGATKKFIIKLLKVQQRS